MLDKNNGYPYEKLKILGATGKANVSQPLNQGLLQHIMTSPLQVLQCSLGLETRSLCTKLQLSNSAASPRQGQIETPFAEGSFQAKGFHSLLPQDPGWGGVGAPCRFLDPPPKILTEWVWDGVRSLQSQNTPGEYIPTCSQAWELS